MELNQHTTYFNKNVFKYDEDFKKQSRKSPQSVRSNEHLHPIHILKNTVKKQFIAPIGVMRTKLKFQCVESHFREVHLKKLSARCLEYYQFVMQPVSMFIVLPELRMMPLESFTHEDIKLDIQASMKSLVERKIKVYLPLAIFRDLELAKVRYRELIEELDRRSPSEPRDVDAPNGLDFACDGPFIVVLYDQVRKQVTCLTRVYKASLGISGMADELRKLRGRDEKMTRTTLRNPTPSPPQIIALTDSAASASVIEDRTLLKKIAEECAELNSHLKSKSKEAPEQEMKHVTFEAPPLPLEFDDLNEEFVVKSQSAGVSSAKPMNRRAALAEDAITEDVVELHRFGDKQVNEKPSALANSGGLASELKRELLRRSTEQQKEQATIERQPASESLSAEMQKKVSIPPVFRVDDRLNRKPQLVVLSESFSGDTQHKTTYSNMKTGRTNPKIGLL